LWQFEQLSTHCGIGTISRGLVSMFRNLLLCWANSHTRKPVLRLTKHGAFAFPSFIPATFRPHPISRLSLTVAPDVALHPRNIGTRSAVGATTFRKGALLPAPLESYCPNPILRGRFSAVGDPDHNEDAAICGQVLLWVVAPPESRFCHRQQINLRQEEQPTYPSVTTAEFIGVAIDRA
jgi:hypothetical protein